MPAHRPRSASPTWRPPRTVPGWASWRGGLEAASDTPPEVEPTRSDDPTLVYFTSGTVAHANIGFRSSATYCLHGRMLLALLPRSTHRDEGVGLWLRR